MFVAVREEWAELFTHVYMLFRQNLKQNYKLFISMQAFKVQHHSGVSSRKQKGLLVLMPKAVKMEYFSHQCFNNPPCKAGLHFLFHHMPVAPSVANV